MDEELESKETEPKKADVPTIVITDVRFPFPVAGWQVHGPFHKTEAEPEAQWQVQHWGLAVMRLRNFIRVTSRPNTHRASVSNHGRRQGHTPRSLDRWIFSEMEKPLTSKPW